jgi:hypothetical protein
MEILKSEAVKTLLEANKSVNKETLYKKDIDALKPGEAIRLTLTAEDWPLKTSPSSYYYRFNKNQGKKVVTVNKLKEGFLITKN